MSGYTTMREAAIWVQTGHEAIVHANYWPQDQASDRQSTNSVKTTQTDAYTAKLIAIGLNPGTTYNYEIVVNGKVERLDYPAQFATPPLYLDRVPPPDFKVAFGGGHYVNDAPFDPPNRIPGGEYSIFLAIEAKKPSLMVWLGNNVFLREADWTSRSGVLARYSKNRAQPELQPLLASTNHIAGISSADFGPEGADKFHPSSSHAREGFDLFWANQPLGQDSVDGVTTTFRWADAEFFILDDRTDRDLNPAAPSKRMILGPEQIEWLINSLKRSTATFKILVMGSPITNPAEAKGNYFELREEREKLLEGVRDARVSGLFIVSGGKDHGELTKMVRANAPDLYELTLGPMTARPASDTKELNYFRVPSTSIFKRHFGILEFHGPESDRQLRVTTYDVNGTQIWSENFRAAEMQF